jgi:hypothetical protein
VQQEETRLPPVLTRRRAQQAAKNERDIENSEPTRARPQDPDNDDSRNAPAEHITNSPTAEHQDARDADKEKDSSGTRPRKIASRFHMTAERARMFRQRQEAEDAEREERLRLLSLQ